MISVYVRWPIFFALATLFTMFANPLSAQTEGTAQQNLPTGSYQLLPFSNSSACMDLQGASSTNGTAIQSYACNGTTAQAWSLIPISGSAGNGYEVRSVSSGSCLDVSNISVDNGALVQEWQCLGASQANQIWQLFPFGNSYELVSLNSGKCLQLPDGNSANGTILQQWSCGQGSNTNELWNLQTTSPEGATVLNLASGPYRVLPVSKLTSCMDLSGAKSVNGTPIQIYSCNETNAQSWSLVPVSVGAKSGYEIVSSSSGSCLDVTNISLDNGALLQEYPCGGATQLNQVWQLFSYGNSYELVSMNSGKCLDLPNGNLTNGTVLQQWSCGEGSNNNQLWNLSAITSAVTTSTLLTASPMSTVTGQTVVLTATMMSTAITGSVSFLDGTAVLGKATLSGGTASFSTTSLVNGTHTLTAQFTGSGAYAASTSAQVQVTVNPSSVGEQASQSQVFFDSVGIETHMSYLNTAFGTQWQTVLQEIKSLGIHHLRDGYYDWPSSSSIVTNHQSLALAGILTTYVVPLDFATTVAQIKATSTNVQDMEMLEASNECDVDPICGGPGLAGINNVVSFLPTVFAAGQSLGIPVLGPAFTTSDAYAAAGNIASKMNYNNLHVYFGGRNPGSNGWGSGDAQGNNYGSFAWWMDQGSLDAPNVPDIITETGYYTVPNPYPYQVTETVGASYIPRTYLLAFNHGVKRTFLHELIDEVASPYFGLLRYDLSERPAFTAVKNMLSLVTDPGIAFNPGKLNYTLSGGDSTLNHTLLQKRDGTFLLVIWLEQSSYDQVNNVNTPVTPETVTLTLSGSAVVRSITVFDGSGNTQTSGVSGSKTTVPFVVSDKLSVVQITPQ